MAKSRSSKQHTTGNLSRSVRPPELSPPNSAATYCTAMGALAPSTAARAATGSNPTTSPPNPQAAPTTPTTSQHCVGFTTMWSSTATATKSTPNHHPNADDSSNPTPADHPDPRHQSRFPRHEYRTSTQLPAEARAEYASVRYRGFRPGQSHCSLRGLWCRYHKTAANPGGKR
jgi:hypothetical protein